MDTLHITVTFGPKPTEPNGKTNGAPVAVAEMRP
jgi:hypothetical protein